LKHELKKRNEYIQTMLDNMPVGVAVIKAGSGQIIYTNNTYQQIHGWPAEKLTSIYDVFNLIFTDADYRAAVLKRVLADVASKDAERMHWDGLEIATMDGENRVINVDNYPIPGQDLMISTVQNVTARKTAEKDLRESEERFRTTLDNLFEGAPNH
jgi:PAS domain S-box-containing protein